MRKEFFLCATSLLISLSCALRSKAYREEAMPEHGMCELITIPMCQNLRYNETMYPNIVGHLTQDEAGYDIHQYSPLVKLECAPNLNFFLCTVFAPLCSVFNEAVQPCRSMCEKARSGCEHLMIRFGFQWPKDLDCNKLPDATEGVLCVGPDADPNYGVTDQFEEKQCASTIGFLCPSTMKVTDDPKNGYSFMGAENCAAPCEKDEIMYWEKYQLDFAHWWIGSWALLCAASTLFTVLTYLIDMPRFRYPERPVVFLSGCYLMVSIAYIAGFFTDNEISCKQFPGAESCPANAQYNSDDCHKVAVQGTKEAGCTIVFMMLYFFSMASSIWWVILTVTWFLAAGLKWGNEAIESISHYFHFVAWAIPAITTIVILAMSRIEGDVLSGVCYVGVYDPQSILVFIIIPLIVFLCVGTAFLVAGFVAMFHIRHVVKHDGLAKVEKLERLMVRIGVFSVLYTVPATVVIACYFYEQTHQEEWKQGWMARNCRKLGIPCPCKFNEYKDAQPDFTVFIIKYFMLMIVGITSGFWIWSGKTFESWSNFKQRLCCSDRKQQGRHNFQSATQSLMHPGQQVTHMHQLKPSNGAYPGRPINDYCI